MGGTSLDPNTGVVTGKIDLSQKPTAAVLPEANKPLAAKDTAQDFSKLKMPPAGGIIDTAIGGTKETIKHVGETIDDSLETAAGQWDKLKTAVSNKVDSVVHAVTHPNETLSAYVGVPPKGEGTNAFSLNGAADNIRAHNKNNSQQ